MYDVELLAAGSLGSSKLSNAFLAFDLRLIFANRVDRYVFIAKRVWNITGGHSGLPSG
jgi:hypothetical protein